MSTVLVLTDGGFKSTFVTGLAVKESGPENVKLLFMDAGQLAAPQQQKAIDAVADFYDLPYTSFQMGVATQGIFELTTYLFTALSYAAQGGFDKVYYGAAKGASRHIINYELTHTHLRNMQLMIRSARLEDRLAHLPEPEAPCMLLNTAQIITMSRVYGVPLEKTWNCNFAFPQHCGCCNKCMRWQAATKKFLDTKYAKVHKLVGI